MRPGPVLMLFAAVLLPSATAAGDQWRIARVWNSQASQSLALTPEAIARTSASIEPPGVLSLGSGCNSMSTRGLKQDGTTRLEEPVMTQKGCPSDLAALEQALVAALRLVRSHERTGNEMILRNSEGNEVVALIR